ncbi:hypothetical protein GOBAR_DD17646 [Gossypium barbadense]|nr:hypothetical protein GOBAR_DD17646 [Gossypium barbadense]
MAVGHSGFAPWMQATGRKRRSAKQIAINKYGKSIVIEKATSKNTRFNILADMEEPDIGESSGSGTEKMAKFTKMKMGGRLKKGKSSIILRLVGLEFEKMASNKLALEGFERLEFDSSKGQEVEDRRQ